MAAQRRISQEQPQVIDIDPTTGRPLGDEDIDTSSLENDQDRLLNDIIAEFDSTSDEVTYRASVTRIPKGYQKGQKEPWLFDCDAAEITGVRNRLRDGYGGGLFRIRVYRNGKLYRQMDYAIEMPQNAAPSGDGRYDALAQALQRTQDQMLALAERLSNPAALPAPSQQIDPLVMMERMSNIMKNITPPQAAQTDMNTFFKAAEFVRDMQPESSGGESWLSILKAVIENPGTGDMIQSMLQHRQQPRRMLGAPGPQRRQMMPGQKPFMRQQQPQTIPQREPSAHDAGNDLSAAIQHLLKAAERDSDPLLYGAWLVDNVPVQLLEPMLADPNVLNTLITPFPRIQNFRPWFEELIEAAKVELSEMKGQHHDASGTAFVQQGNTGWNGGDPGNPEMDGQANQGSAPEHGNPVHSGGTGS